MYPDRELRSGGRWSTPDLTDELLRLATTERAVAHVAAGWVPKVPSLDGKLALASELDGAMGRAASLRRHAETLFTRDEGALMVHREWVEPVRSLDLADDADAVVAGLRAVHALLLDSYRRLDGSLDHLYDAQLLRTVRSAMSELDRGQDRTGRRTSEELSAAWRRPHGSDRVHIDEAIWSPVDRVPVPARPPGRPRPESGALGHLSFGSRREGDNMIRELNENVTAELCAMELMCRSSYEHPDLAWAFHSAAARHASDEARHAAMFRRLIACRNGAETDLPQHASNYEYSYEFPECDPGSKRELLWRLLLLCTVLEALAIDKVPHEIATMDWLDEPDVARAQDYILADELFHAENGLRWTRRLCAELGLDPMIERERVHGRFLARQYDVRRQYLDADPERAAREAARLDGPDPDAVPFTSRTEVELRRRASFTDAECEQADRWGYSGAAAQGGTAPAGS